MSKKILIAVGVVIAIIFLSWQTSRPVTLTIGMFAGNNWDVPQGEPYAIIDEVIKNFEAENPDVKIKYVSGIKKEDYSEWLAERFIDGDEPDVFMVLAEDFNLYASMGALMNLEDFIADDKNFSADVYYPAAVNFGKANHQEAVYRLSDGREIRLTEDDEYVSPSNLIIYYDPETGKEALLAAAKDYGATILYVYNIIPGIAVSIPDGKNIIEAIAFFEKISGVTSVERDHIYHID